MSISDLIYNIVLGGLMLWGLGSIIYTIPKVASWWKPVYWLALPLTLLPIVIIVAIFTGIIAGPNLLVMLKVTMFVLGLELIAVPWVHRLEARLLRTHPHSEDHDDRGC